MIYLLDRHTVTQPVDIERLGEDRNRPDATQHGSPCPRKRMMPDMKTKIIAMRTAMRRIRGWLLLAAVAVASVAAVAYAYTPNRPPL